MTRTRIEEAGLAKRGKKVSGGHFFRPGEIPSAAGRSPEERKGEARERKWREKRLQGHHDAQIRTLHIVRNIFAFKVTITPEA